MPGRFSNGTCPLHEFEQFDFSGPQCNFVTHPDAQPRLDGPSSGRFGLHVTANCKPELSASGIPNVESKRRLRDELPRIQTGYCGSDGLKHDRWLAI